jgi:hypothetical protein
METNTGLQSLYLSVVGMTLAYRQGNELNMGKTPTHSGRDFLCSDELTGTQSADDDATKDVFSSKPPKPSETVRGLFSLVSSLWFFSLPPD